MSFRIDIRVIDVAARRLERATAAGERGIYRAINKVAGPAFRRAKRLITSQVNLTDKYLKEADSTGKERIRLIPATGSKLFAEIRARRRGTRLATYGAKQLRRRAKRPDKAKGDALRKIPPGSKQAGVSVKVSRRDGRKPMRGAFLVPLRRGLDNATVGDNGMGIFIRVGSGRKDIKHKYGPSVDQVFNRVKDEMIPDVREALIIAVRSQMRYEFRKG